MAKDFKVGDKVKSKINDMFTFVVIRVGRINLDVQIIDDGWTDIKHKNIHHKTFIKLANNE